MKVLFFDIEILNDPKKLFEFAWKIYPGATMGAEMSTICSFGYKWLGDKKAKCINVWDKKKYSINDDRALLQEIRDIMVEADIIVSFYGKKFDIKHIDARLDHHGLRALPPFKGHHLDLHELAKRRYKLSFKRLDNLADFLRCGTKKLKHEGFSLWDKSWNLDKKAQKTMSAYCAQDVEVLAKVYDKMQSIITFPITQKKSELPAEKCEHCGSKHFVKNGTRRSATGVVQMRFCGNCGRSSNFYLPKQD
jgi:DNA polymerase elongation subunit (family B)